MLTHLSFGRTLAGAFLASVLLAGPAAALDQSRPLLCAMGQAFECDRAKACERMDASEIGAPRFFRIDLAAKTAQGVGAGARGRQSAIRSVDTVGPLLIMQGADEAAGDERSAIGWTASISTDDGAMVLIAAGDDTAFLLFGDCLFEE